MAVAVNKVKSFQIPIEQANGSSAYPEGCQRETLEKPQDKDTTIQYNRSVE
ncbi:hypothetical protein BN8_05917 [Fibrisoma limi BUZ 3]|uniref:Uncharacterized protein n=1 Tax=Fibrisoma limi BUZ 3 TaxID=1185876 RepID=I2GRN3_9BACT|nr:hypothetical protein BN8_05917 [Fibrisoma limi BUZ 3]